MITSFFVAIFIIFTILVLQFNSYWQPLIVLYSVVMALIWVNIWLFATGNPYSLSFWIWFISLVWIVVNNAIIYIDKINSNLEEWMDSMNAVLNAWKARFIPMLVTTITTVLWILPLAFQDKFWAWLSYTIVFGLIAGTTMTLFVVPALYYECYLNKKPWLFAFLFKYTLGLPKIIINLFKVSKVTPKKITNIINKDK
jgi:multidrug efflux pump subunit AcrB